ncbi:hypothetical protein [Janthinobacterium aquaticum]|uniref:hypothetical protein n=1 Tax=Janthinobacterium sp. FT58W TaxID=2654254 RepID=UPI0012658CC1|nr:hypothetical protein [Janthinobacterium sp. FT58W]KAB8036341.1 hypothetical protein GCM43_24700 [Janthinobacterium sp. FT58W]
MTSALLSVLITSDVVTARTQAAPSIAVVPAAPAGASAREPEPGLNEPAPHVLLAVAVGLLLLRVGSGQRSEKFNH